MNIPVTDNGKPVQPGDSYFKYKGVYHPVVWVRDTPYRPRVETLVLMNGNMVYVRIKDEDRRGSSGNGECYELPGGSIDADCEPIQQAENEVNEEALISVKNIYDTGIQYYADYPSGFIMSGGDTPLEYAGHISTVYVAEYDGIYDREKVEKKDLDPKISENGKFYPITKMVPLFRQEHINALLNSPYVSDAVKGAIRIINRKSNPTPKKNPVASDKIVGELFFVSRLGNLEYMKGSTFKNGRLHIDTGGKSVIRVFSSVEDAINGYDSVLDKLTSGTSVYVYTIKNKADRIICPTTQQSPSSKITSEMWIPAEEPVGVKRVGLICITDTGETSKYYYGKNSLLVGALPKFSYTWTIKDRVTNVMESNVLVKDNKIYHGSTYLIDKFVPMSLDLGNATQEPGWSTFAFADYTLALRFGLMRAIQKVKEYYKDRCKDVVCSWSVVDKKPFISSDQYKFMKPLIMNFKYYVYTIDSTNLDLGIGNDENFPEVTFRESGIVPESTDVIKIDEPLLKEHLLILPGDMTIEEYTSSQEKMMNRAHNRGWYAIMMTKDYNNGLASAQLQKAVRDGYLKPGDDISTYMSKRGIAFDDDSISIKSYLTESSDEIEDIYESKSTINSKYKPKGKKSLSSFKRVHLTQTIIDRYKREYPFLKHVRCKDTNQYICDGYIWFDDDELVAMVGSCEYTDDKTKWVVSLEITNKYRGYGLSKQILDYAVKTMNCKYLSVNKNNKIAKKVYDNYGFKVYQEDNTMYYMTIDNNTDIVSVTEAAEYSSVNKYPVFIILMHTGTPLSTTIKAVTHDEFSHAAVSFNSKLDPLYSFGTKKYGHHEHGLVQHNTKDDFYRHYHATYSVFVMYVSKEQRDKMLTRLRYFIENEANIKFDIASLIACAMQIPTEFRKKFFCSRFVMEIIGQGIELSKYPSMWTPQQISELDNITMVNKGDDLYMYDYRITEKNLKKIRDGKLDDIVMESVRSELPDSEFGLPDKRKYPLHDPAHVQSAIKFFNYVSEEDEKELAKNILKKIDEYGMKGEISVTKKNRFFKYAKSSGIMEAITIQSDTDKDCMNQLVMGLPANVRTKVIEKLSRYNPSNIIYEDCLYVDGCIASALTVYKDSIDRSIAHMIVVENEKSKSSEMESMINDVISGISLLYEDIETLCVLSLPAHMDAPCIMDIQREKSNIVYEGYLPIPVMEAPNEDEDTATDYTEDVADDDGGGDAEGEETATDYTEDADTGEGEETEDDTAEDEDTQDDTTTEEEGDQGDAEGGDDDLQATDYTDGADTGEDTPGDVEGAATDGGTPRNGNLIDNNVLKNYSVLRNFEKLYNLTKEVSDSLDSVVMPSKLQNTVLAQVLKNLNSIKEFILSYVKFQFSSDNYAQNLYYYNLVLQTLNLNLELLKSNKELEDTKLSKKNSRR